MDAAAARSYASFASSGLLSPLKPRRTTGTMAPNAAHPMPFNTSGFVAGRYSAFRSMASKILRVGMSYVRMSLGTTPAPRALIKFERWTYCRPQVFSRVPSMPWSIIVRPLTASTIRPKYCPPSTERLSENPCERTMTSR